MPTLDAGILDPQCVRQLKTGYQAKIFCGFTAWRDALEPDKLSPWRDAEWTREVNLVDLLSSHDYLEAAQRQADVSIPSSHFAGTSASEQTI